MVAVLRLPKEYDSLYHSVNRIKKAQQWGEVSDLPFPQIDPLATSEEIDQIVDRYFADIIAKQPAAVMLQGEFVFTFRLANRLKGAGITVVAGCSERRAVERVDKDGKSVKESTFEFVQFRAF